MSTSRKSRTASLLPTALGEFKAKFLLLCEEEGVEDPPNVVKVDTLKRSRFSLVPIIEQSAEEYVKFCSKDNSKEEEQKDAKTEILVQFENGETPQLKGLQVKGKLVTAALSSALGRTMTQYSHLTILKLIKCSLVAESLHWLKFCLKNTSITHLYLDENIIPYQNYNLVLEEDSKLLHYSLRLNMITDCGASYLAKSLKYTHPYHQILRSLNLNCNLIDDDGACALANALRWNRNLTCLALAGNRIGDKGATALARTLLQFNLTKEELEFRAELLCNRLLQVKAIMEEGPQKANETSKLPSSTLNPGAGSFIGQPPEYPGPMAELNELMWYYYSLETWADDQVPPITNPLVSDVAEGEDGEYKCKGNDALWYLNLSYNLMTEDSLLVFMEAFKYQETSIAEFDRRLWRFEYQGNPYDPEHPVIDEIETYLTAYRSRTSLSSSRKASRSSLKSKLGKDKVK